MQNQARFGRFLVVFVTCSFAGFLGGLSVIGSVQTPNIKLTYFAFTKECPTTYGWSYNLTNYGGKGYARVEFLLNGNYSGSATDLVLAGQTIGGGGFLAELNYIPNCSSLTGTAHITQQWAYSQFPQSKP